MEKEKTIDKFLGIANEIIDSGGRVALNILLPVVGPIINEAFDIPIESPGR
jgi:hypothetical protein